MNLKLILGIIAFFIFTSPEAFARNDARDYCYYKWGSNTTVPYFDCLQTEGVATAQDLRDKCYYKWGSNKTEPYFDCLKTEGVYRDGHRRRPYETTPPPSSVSCPSVPEPEENCVRMPFGITEACTKAFAGEQNPNPSQIQLAQDLCVQDALNIEIVNRCLRKVPLNSGKLGASTVDRSTCIRDLSNFSGGGPRRCQVQ